MSLVNILSATHDHPSITQTKTMHTAPLPSRSLPSGHGCRPPQVAPMVAVPDAG
jgi:hypothetical protein